MSNKLQNCLLFNQYLILLILLCVFCSLEISNSQIFFPKNSSTWREIYTAWLETDFRQFFSHFAVLTGVQFLMIWYKNSRADGIGFTRRVHLRREKALRPQATLATPAMLGSKNETTTLEESRPWESLRTAATDVRLMCEQRWARRGANCVLKSSQFQVRVRDTSFVFYEKQTVFPPFFLNVKKSCENDGGWKDKSFAEIYSQTNPGFSIPYWRERLFLDWNERVREQSFFKNDSGELLLRKKSLKVTENL